MEACRALSVKHKTSAVKQLSELRQHIIALQMPCAAVQPTEKLLSSMLTWVCAVCCALPLTRWVLRVP